MKRSLYGFLKGTGKAAAIYVVIELLAAVVLAGLALFHFFGKTHGR